MSGLGTRTLMVSAALALATVASGCGLLFNSGTTPLYEVVAYSPTRLTAKIEFCYEDVWAEVDEIGDDIRVTARWEGRCDDDRGVAVGIELSEPLGDRRVFDVVADGYVPVDTTLID